MRSGDGIVQERCDDEAGPEWSDADWDSEVVEDPSVYEHGGTRHMLGNGNGFGLSGFGHFDEDG